MTETDDIGPQLFGIPVWQVSRAVALGVGAFMIILFTIDYTIVDEDQPQYGPRALWLPSLIMFNVFLVAVLLAAARLPRLGCLLCVLVSGYAVLQEHDLWLGLAFWAMGGLLFFSWYWRPQPPGIPTL